MHKIIVLNQPMMSVDVLPVSDKEYEDFSVGGDFDDIEFISSRGYSPNEVHWMMCDDDPCEIPVFWDSEVIPYFTL